MSNDAPTVEQKPWLDTWWKVTGAVAAILIAAYLVWQNQGENDQPGNRHYVWHDCPIIEWNTGKEIALA